MYGMNSELRRGDVHLEGGGGEGVGGGAEVGVDGVVLPGVADAEGRCKVQDGRW